MMGNFPWVWIVVGAVLIVLVITFFITMKPRLWFKAMVSGTYIPMSRILGMRVKRLDAQMLVQLYIKARKSGVMITVDQLENHAQARGNIQNVITACIAAHNAGIALPVETAMAIDLAGRDISDAVKHCITPKVIETEKVSAVAKNGIELAAKAKITLRTNLKRIIGGALEETIIARVCEGIVTSIGNASNHKELLENPDRISKQLLVNRSISSDTAFDILSIDISDIDVGRNIGAELDIDQAEATKFISQAEAEERRAKALAAEQEMRALTQEMRAQVVAQEAHLTASLADALQRGNLGMGDFYRMQNLISDTEMRKSIAGTQQQDRLPAPKKKTRLG
jgi:uncharacterized protein YqfA (UPF0365 family)